MPEERLQKILARAGYGSRRAAEGLITAGRVTVNGQRAALGSKADPSRDSIAVDGTRIKLAGQHIYYAVYKPREVLSTTSGPDPRPKVTDLVPGGAQLHMVGRLDFESEGLMLLTTDGELTQRLTHPRYEAEKEYRVLVARHPDPEQLAAWRRGVVLPDGSRSAPSDVRIERAQGKGIWLRVVMHEGKKREIREIARSLGLPVAKLIRVRIASLRLGAMKPADWRTLTSDEIAALKSGAKPAEIPKPFKPRKPNSPRHAGAPSNRKPTARKQFKPAKPSSTRETKATSKPGSSRDSKTPRKPSPRKRLNLQKRTRY